MPLPAHPSAAAPRQSEAFTRLGAASLVSSSVFKAKSPQKQTPSSNTSSSNPLRSSQMPPFDQLAKSSLVSSSPFKSPLQHQKQLQNHHPLKPSSLDMHPTPSHPAIRPHRLAGPRSFSPPTTPPPSTDTHPQKTVTWGGNQVLEFEPDELSHRSSTDYSSSTDDNLLFPDSELTSDDLEHTPSDQDHSLSEQDLAEPDHPELALLPHQQSQSPEPELNPATDTPDHSLQSVLPPSPPSGPTHISVPLPPTDSFSSDSDPVDRMVDALLTSADLLGHPPTSQPWPMPQPPSPQHPVSLPDSSPSSPCPSAQEAVSQPPRAPRFPYVLPPSPTVNRPGSPQSPLKHCLPTSTTLSSDIPPCTSTTTLDSSSASQSQPNSGSAPPVKQCIDSPKPPAFGSPRRPLPRPPPTAAPESSSSMPSALTAPAYTLPEIAQGASFVSSSNQPSTPVMSFPRPHLDSITSELDLGGEGVHASPGGSRKRITRQKIHERMRERDKSPTVEILDDSFQGSLTRIRSSHSVSVFELGANGMGENAPVRNRMAPSHRHHPSAEAWVPSGSTPQHSHQITARQSLPALPMGVSDVLNRSAPDESGPMEEDRVRLEGTVPVSGGPDKLVTGFRCSENDTGVPKSPESCSGSSSFMDQDDEDDISPQSLSLSSKMVRIKGVGKRRRSFTTGGLESPQVKTSNMVKSPSVKRRSLAPAEESEDSSLADCTDFQAPLDRALKTILDNGHRGYRVQEAEEVVVASDNPMHGVGSPAGVGLAAAQNRNWRKVRKVSDLNEHEKQLKAFWAESQYASHKIGKVFVKMSKLVFKGLPGTSQPVYFEVIVDNGLHTAKTATYKLEHELTLGAEFELVRAKKLEFSLAFHVPLNDPRNAHLRKKLSSPYPSSFPQAPPPVHENPTLIKAKTPHSVLPSLSNSPKRGLAAKLFGGVSTKRFVKKDVAVQQQQVLDRRRKKKDGEIEAIPVPEPVHPLLALLDRDGNLAKAVVNFEHYAEESLGQSKQVVIPCAAAVFDHSRNRTSAVTTMGQITIEFLALPPMPQVPDAVLPDSSAECLKGLKIAEWWQQVWHVGVLSQMGADCQTWRRRTFKATGGSLFAYNDIINKISAEIRLTEVVSIEDCGSVPAGTSCDEGSSKNKSVVMTLSEDSEVLPPFTFRLVFKDRSEVLFHADNQVEYRRWKNVLGQLLGKIQKLPAWAEILRLQIAAKRASEAEGTEVSSGEADEQEDDDNPKDCRAPLLEKSTRPLPGRRTDGSTTTSSRPPPPSLVRAMGVNARAQQNWARPCSTASSSGTGTASSSCQSLTCNSASTLVGTSQVSSGLKRSNGPLLINFSNGSAHTPRGL